jgi:hypothetical protein
VIKVGRLAIEALAPVFFLERAVWQPDVGLRRRFAFLERIHAASFFIFRIAAFTAFSNPQMSLKSRINSNTR